MECLDLQRRLRRQIVEGVQYPFGLTSLGGKLYYTDWRRYVLRNRIFGWVTLTGCSTTWFSVRFRLKSSSGDTFR